MESFMFPVLRANNTIPHYFSEDEVHKIFDAASCNIKRLAMLQVYSSAACALQSHAP